LNEPDAAVTNDPFANALAAYQGGRSDAARALLVDLLRQQPAHADGQHLAALIARQEGRLLQALQHFSASLASNERQPVVHANFGNLLVDLKRYGDAERHYRRATELLPNSAEAWYRRGVLATDRYQLDLALECLRRARALKADGKTLLALGRAELSAGDAAGALETARTLRNLLPRDARGVALAARALQALQQGAAALELLEQQRQHVDEPAAIDYELGLIALDGDDNDRAITALERCIEQQPDHIEAHRALNNLLWQRRDARFLGSYHQALKQHPDVAPLYHNMAAGYIASGQEREATRSLEFAIERLGRDPFLLHGLGVQALKHGNVEIARDFIDEALKVAPDVTRFRVDRANLHIQRGDYAAAAPELEHALKLEPYNQEVWAYLGLLWRLTGDAREHWLNDYDALLRDYELPPPQGYATIGDFMQELAEYLQSRHTNTRQPLDQSVRGGTQTTGILLDDPQPLIQKLKTAVQLCAADYLGALQFDATHPFLSRLVSSKIGHAAWRFAGSWSVSLEAQGFHTYHVHPYGWLSCCNYIALPESIDLADDDRSGWIQFGQSSLALGEREIVARAIQPRVGHCVFFPGYFWHGTVPFSGTRRRLTVPCDFEPLA
jgi:tetratricopeptide (TPR) repeat protein